MFSTSMAISSVSGMATSFPRPQKGHCACTNYGEFGLTSPKPPIRCNWSSASVTRNALSHLSPNLALFWIGRCSLGSSPLVSPHRSHVGRKRLHRSSIITCETSRESPELQSKPDSSGASSLPKFGSGANLLDGDQTVNSSVDNDVYSPDGSIYAEESPRSSEEMGSSSSSYEYMDALPKVRGEPSPVDQQDGILETLILISPFFLWGTAMVAMKGLLPRAGPMFVASVRLIPAGFLLIGYGSWIGKKQPAGLMAWLSIALFGLVDASCFQGFLAEGLKRTSAGLGSVIIDSQPLTVAILAALFFGESLGLVNYTGLAVGIAGLFLLEVPLDALQSFLPSAGEFDVSPLLGDTAWLNELVSEDRGEWRMLLAAQSMALGTVMIRWVCQYSDPFMATGWHMVLGGIPLLILSVIQQDPALNGHIQDLSISDWSALLYTSVGGSAISYGLFFYNATRGSLTRLSSLTFLTPMFAALFGSLFLSETLTPLQVFGGAITLGGVLLVNYKPSEAIDDANNK